MVQADAHRHHQPAVFLTVFSPVDDRSKMQISVRQLNIQRIIGQPGNIRCIKPVRMVHHVQPVFPCFLCILHIVHGVPVKLFIIFIIGRINRSAGFRIFMKDILDRIYAVIADQLIRLPEISHLIVIP